MLAGFKSRWIRPCAAAAINARVTWMAISSAAPTFNGPSRLTSCLQGFALDQLHRVIAAINLRRGAELKNTRHIGMAQSRRGARLAQEPFARRVRATSLGRYLEDFEGDVAMQHFVARRDK